MLYKTYEFHCHMPADSAIELVKGLFSSEGVEYNTSNLSVRSVRTPIAVLGIQPVMYSNNNWVGLNPFAFVGGVEVNCAQVASGLTSVTLRINRLRGFLWVAFFMACSLFAAPMMPKPGGLILLAGVGCITWLSIVSFLGGFLLKKEIKDYLKKAGGGGLIR